MDDKEYYLVLNANGEFVVVSPEDAEEILLEIPA